MIWNNRVFGVLKINKFIIINWFLNVGIEGISVPNGKNNFTESEWECSAQVIRNRSLSLY